MSTCTHCDVKPAFRDGLCSGCWNHLNKMKGMFKCMTVLHKAQDRVPRQRHVCKRCLRLGDYERVYEIRATVSKKVILRECIKQPDKKCRAKIDKRMLDLYHRVNAGLKFNYEVLAVQGKDLEFIPEDCSYYLEHLVSSDKGRMVT